MQPFVVARTTKLSLGGVLHESAMISLSFSQLVPHPEAVANRGYSPYLRAHEIFVGAHTRGGVVSPCFVPVNAFQFWLHY